VPIAALRNARRKGGNPAGPPRFDRHLRCGKGARLGVPASTARARSEPKPRLITQQAVRPSIVAIKAAPFAGNNPQESETPPQPRRWLAR